jgi:hypothetical protein
MMKPSFSIQMPLIMPLIEDENAATKPRKKKESIRDRFHRFHNRNPHVYDTIISIAVQMKKANVHKFGMKGIFEYLRWQYSMQTQGESYKLNNIYTALYARLVMDHEPELRGFFETRKRLEE